MPLMVVMFLLANPIIRWFVLPLTQVLQASGLPPVVQTLSPQEMLLTKFKLAFICALVISAPWILYQGWKFIAPGLHQHERRFVRFLIPGSAVLTAAGVSLMYWVMLPLMLFVLVAVSTSVNLSPPTDMTDPRVVEAMDLVTTVELRTVEPEAPADGDVWMQWPSMELRVAVPGDTPGTVEILSVPKPPPSSVEQQFRLSSYLNFVLLLMLGIVIAFQMPLVMLLLGWLGLADPDWLAGRRRHALLVLGLVSALVTPADALSMLMMLFPLYGLYELGIWLMRRAPASAVAEGELFRLRRVFGRRATSAPDKPTPPSAQAGEPSQTDGTIPRTPPARQSDSPPTDGEGDSS